MSKPKRSALSPALDIYQRYDMFLSTAEVIANGDRIADAYPYLGDIAANGLADLHARNPWWTAIIRWKRVDPVHVQRLLIAHTGQEPGALDPGSRFAFGQARQAVLMGCSPGDAWPQCYVRGSLSMTSDARQIAS